MIGTIVLIRTFSSGVHFGVLESRTGKEVLLKNARRIWYWSGAASLSQLAVEGVKNPESCKITMPVNEILLTEFIEIIPLTEIAIDNLKKVSEWKV